MHLSRSNRFIISIVLLVISIFIAEKFGLVDLIKNGYGTLTWAYWIVFVIPVLFVAIKKIYLSK